MTYENGTAIDLEDLLAKLDTFATTTHGGWSGYTTNPNTTNGWFELHKGSLSASFKYPTSSPLHLSVHQATAFVNDSTAPGKHTNDSGNGYNTTDTGHTNANLLGERCVQDIGDGPFPSYHFFADDTTVDYIHVATLTAGGFYRHFGFGNLEKFGDNWTGGEYAYGHLQDTGTNVNALDTDSHTLLDAVCSTGEKQHCATLHIGQSSGLLNCGTARWGAVANDSSPNTDTAGLPRRQIHGGYRGGMAARGFGNPIGNLSSGLIPLVPIPVFYRDPSNPRVQYLGRMPDVRFLNIKNFEPEQEITIGSDVWVVFPHSLKTQSLIVNHSQNLGIAYRKVV